MENITLEQAVEALLQATKAIEETEEVTLLKAGGRILAEDLIAPFHNPPFDRSPIDGYACKAEDLTGASKEHPVVLKVVEEVDAGDYSERTVLNGEAIRIMTGAAIPKGCNCCIRQEDTDYGEELVQIYKAEQEWGNYCFAGEDFKKGTLLLKKGTKLGFVELGVCAGMGCDRVKVLCQPKVVILTSGDEVTEPGKPLLPGKIYNINQILLAARIKELGVEPIYIASVEDDPAAMKKELEKACSYADFIITTGAVSVGKKDIMHAALAMLGAEKVFWRVKVKPGMPTLFSVYQKVPILSLSGNPFGVAVTVELLARPVLEKMMSDESLALMYQKGIMKDTFDKVSKGRRFVRAMYKDGEVRLPDGLHSNGVIASMAGCNCLIDVPGGSDILKPGDPVQVVML